MSREFSGSSTQRDVQPTTSPFEVTPTPEGNTSETQTPPPPVISDNELVGTWELDHGIPLYFFGSSEYIIIIEHGDGTFGVYESEYEEWGELRILSNGRMVVDGEWSGEWEFTYIISGNKLTIVDSDGDEAHYLKQG